MINIIHMKKKFMSASITKKNQLSWLNRDGDIQNSYRKDTYGPPCMLYCYECETRNVQRTKYAVVLVFVRVFVC